MQVRSLHAPAFGQADLSNCEREQIHLAGSIQPHGVLLVVREPDLVVVQASANAPALLGLPGRVIGRSLVDLKGDLAARLRPLLERTLDQIPSVFRCRVGAGGRAFDGLVHRPPDGGLIVELEPAGGAVDLASQVENGLHTVLGAPTLATLADEAAKLFKDLTGYDRVMIYRFDDEGHGEVFAEQRNPGLEPYLGNRYPASDIPQIARRLYERNRIRVLVDINYAPVPIEPPQSPLSARELDMSLCYLRSISPIHVQYLKNMGVGGTLVASLVVGGRLWGLVSCHHYVSRTVQYEVRVACELLAESVATRITALESFVQAQAELSVRRIEQRMAEAIAREGDWRAALFDASQPLLQPLRASGAALLLDGQSLTAGEVPGTQALREIGAWLDRQPHDGIVATASLSAAEPAFEAIKGSASGLVAAPLSSAPGEYLIWFRPERVRTVTWGGDPNKAFVVGDDPADLSPRRSFAQWHQLVEGTSDPWTAADLAAARLLGESVADVVLQFRSVRMLIARDQLEQVSGQVRRSEQAVLLADANGRVLMSNAAFDELLPAGTRPPLALDELARLFLDTGDVRRRLEEMLERERPWRGEVRLLGEGGRTRPLQVRADPVVSSPRRLLGFVLLFTDLTERHNAEAARRRFQEGILEQHRVAPSRLDGGEDLLYRKLLSSVIGNAQLAALEITDGVDVARMPEMLESVRISVGRTNELLAHLIRRGSRGGRD